MKRAIITGASSGIGQELARELARRGYMLALLARRADLLDQLAAELPDTTATIVCDVTDKECVRTAVRRLGGVFDLAVANAGVSIAMHATNFKLDAAEEIMRVNYLGMLYLFDAVIPGMVERKRGRFVGVASIAGLRGIPAAAPYSASKAAMQTFLEAARVELKPYGVGVTIVNPGFVATPMTARHRFRMPFLMQPGDAARVIADGIEKGKRVVEFPWPMSRLARLLRALPDPLYDRVTARAGRRRT